MKKKLLTEIAYFFFIFIFFFIISIYFFQDYLNSHWTTSYDQETALAYNALLFNSGIEQEMTDHSAYFTILFTSFFLVGLLGVVLLFVELLGVISAMLYI